MANSGIPHILIVDDEPDVEALFRQKFRRRLRSGDFVFEFAANGKEGLDQVIANAEIGIVFTDVNMPVMDGLEFLRHLHLQKDRVLKTLVISAYGDMSNIRQAMNLGAMDFIVKPIDLDDLETTLLKAVEEWKELAAGRDAALALEAAQRQKVLAEESRQLQKQFFDNVTHELRTPLTLLLGPLETAMDGATNSEVVRNLFLARKNGNILLKLIDELLDVARIEAGSMELHLIHADLNAFLQDLADSFNPLARSLGITLTYEPATHVLMLDFDAEKLRKVFSNLLSNALKFTPSGGEVWFKLSGKPGEAEVRITVQDTGPGIPKADLPHVFERFYRASKGTTQSVRGVGIGLSLSRDLVGLHAGRIAVTSDKGACFEVALPQRNEAVAGDPGTAWIQVAEVIPSPEVAASPGGEEGLPLLLLTEDNAEMLAHIRGHLSGHYRMLEASNGEEGFALACEEVPDLIISDVMMPVMDGQEFCQRLKQETATSHIPIILLTARAQAQDRLEGLKIGADAYLTKPFHKEELLAVAANLVASRRLLREKYRQEHLHTPKNEASSSMEEQFLQSVRQVMAAHLADELFGVGQMAEEIGMSRKTLHRKLKAIIGQTPIQFIRQFRLEAAMALLKTKTNPIGEVAFLTGFSSHSYFSKCFTEYFKVSPSEVV